MRNIVPWTSVKLFPGWCNIDSLLIIFVLRMMQCKWTFIKCITISTPQKCPMLQQQLWKMHFVASNSQVYCNNLHNRPSADFQSRVHLFNEALPWSVMKPQIMTLFYLASESLKIYGHVIVAQRRLTAEQSAPTFHNLPLQVKERTLVNCRPTTAKHHKCEPGSLQCDCHTSK